MDDASRCEKCGGPLVHEEGLGRSCPRCLLLLAMPGENAGGPATGSRLEPGTTIGRYRIVRLIGDGGMGTVYEAEQEFPRRTVALKLIKPEFTSLELLRRFEQEARALGRLQHPGIAQIYEAGAADTGHGPQPYFAMEFIHGRSLREYAGQHHLSARDRLALVARVCDAVHHAHQRGLIHRDLKPDNILVDESGQPKVLDFGVARVTDGDMQTTLWTGIGQLVGTLAYMSPEQVLDDPLELDTRSDVYALGVVLYELLANRMPYSIGKTVLEAAHAIREEDPARLSSIDRKYRGDIETIAAMALEKDKTRRYSSAAELAADIRRYLNDEPIVARPPSASYQLQKFARRNKALVTGLVAVLVVSVAGAATATWFAVRFNHESVRAVQAEKKTGIALDLANENEQKAIAREQEAREQVTIANQERARADDQRARADEAAARANRERDKLTWQDLARQAVRLLGAGDNDELAALLARQAFLIHGKTPEQPRFLVEEALQQADRLSPFGRVLSGHSSEISSVTFSADGTRLASGSKDGTVRVWDLKNSNTPPLLFTHIDGEVTSVALSRDGLLAASSEGELGEGKGGTVLIWNLREPAAPPRTVRSPGKVIFWNPLGPPFGPTAPPSPGTALRSRIVRSPIYSVAFSPDGSLLAIAGESVSIWALPDLASPSFVFDSEPMCLAFSPDGSRLATGGQYGIQIWDVKNPGTAPLMRFADHDRIFSSVAFSSDKVHVAGRDRNGNVRVYDIRNRTSDRRLAESSPKLDEDFDIANTNALNFSPGGNQLASSGNDGVIRVWDLSKPDTDPVLSLRGHRGIANAVAFSSDGAELASGGRDNLVHVWSLREPAGGLKRFKAHEGIVQSLEFSPNSAHLASGGRDGFVRLWDPRAPQKTPVVFQHEDAVFSLAISQDSRLLASATKRLGAPSSGLLRVWNILSPATPRLLTSEPSVQSLELSTDSSLEFSTDSAMLTGFSIRRDFRISPSASVQQWQWDLRTAQFQILKEIPPHLAPRKSSASSQRGDLVASIGGNNVSVSKRGDPKGPYLTFRWLSYLFVAFTSEDTRLIAVAGPDPFGARMWDLEPNAEPLFFKSGKANIFSAAVSRDGAYLALGDRDGYISMWPLWKAAADELCARVTRNLSMEEWRRYVGESIPYERTCPELPAGTRAH